jgi:translation initiation factor RLI1
LIAKKIKGRVDKVIQATDKRGKSKSLIKKLEMGDLLDRKVKELSGGEL